MSETSPDIKWLQEVEDIPDRAKKDGDPLAAEVLRRFNGAVSWQSSERVNGKPLRTVLEECWQQQNGILSFEARERAEKMGVNIHINLTALKADIANSFLNDALTSSGGAELPWIVEATPRPDISPTAQDEVFKQVVEPLEQGMFDGDPQMLVAYIRQAKKRMLVEETQKAEKAASAMQNLIEDQCAEGGFTRALTDFLQYFPIYPFAVFSGPYMVKAPRLIWGRTKPRMQDEVFTQYRAISPFDFVYSPDSPDTQRGTCVFTRTLWMRRDLLNAAAMPGYINENVLKVLEDADTNMDFNLAWLSRSPEQADRNMALWASNVRPIEVLTHYGFFSGRELEKYNFKGLVDKEYYNTQISMVAGKIIECKVFSDPKLQTRPIYTASFYRTGGDKIAGDGIAQRLRDIERAYIACVTYLMRNAANASAPLCEADYDRIKGFMGEGEIGNIVPGTMYLSNASLVNNGQPAFKFFNIPANMPAYTQLMEMFMQLADKVTNIPASLHGEAVGSGAMRTFRGMSMLQGNATKALHAATDNICYGVFEPLGELLYNMNMIYSSDVDVKGDSHIMTKGADGLLKKETERQSAMELLNVVGGASQGLAVAFQSPLAPVMVWALMKLFDAMGVPEDILGQMDMLFGAMGQQGGMGMAAGGPASNPAPDNSGGEGAMADANGGGQQ